MGYKPRAYVTSMFPVMLPCVSGISTDDQMPIIRVAAIFTGVPVMIQYGLPVSPLSLSSYLADSLSIGSTPSTSIF